MFLLPGLEFIFLSRRWTVSREIVSTKPNSTALSASKRTEKSIMSVGRWATGDDDQMGRLQSRERAAAVLLDFIVQDRFQPALREAPPHVRNGRLTTSKASAMAAVLHPSADLSRMRARVTVRALALPRWIMASKVACSSQVKHTADGNSIASPPFLASELSGGWATARILRIAHERHEHRKPRSRCSPCSGCAWGRPVFLSMW